MSVIISVAGELDTREDLFESQEEAIRNHWDYLTHTPDSIRFYHDPPLGDVIYLNYYGPLNEDALVLTLYKICEIVSLSAAEIECKEDGSGREWNYTFDRDGQLWKMGEGYTTYTPGVPVPRPEPSDNCVPVIRCKNCQCYNSESQICEMHHIHRLGEDFCSDGYDGSGLPRPDPASSRCKLCGSCMLGEEA